MSPSKGAAAQNLYQNQNSGSYDNWPGIAFQQIMGQIDLAKNSQNGSGNWFQSSQTNSTLVQVSML